jgi:hypothetical protein
MNSSEGEDTRSDARVLNSEIKVLREELGGRYTVKSLKV